LFKELIFKKVQGFPPWLLFLFILTQVVEIRNYVIYFVYNPFSDYISFFGKNRGQLYFSLNKRGFCLLFYRYLCLIAHYRSKLTFSWKSLEAAQNVLKNLYQKTAEVRPRQNYLNHENKKRQVSCLKIEIKF